MVIKPSYYRHPHCYCGAVGPGRSLARDICTLLPCTAEWGGHVSAALGGSWGPLAAPLSWGGPCSAVRGGLLPNPALAAPPHGAGLAGERGCKGEGSAQGLLCRRGGGGGQGGEAAGAGIRAGGCDAAPRSKETQKKPPPQPGPGGRNRSGTGTGPAPRTAPPPRTAPRAGTAATGDRPGWGRTGPGPSDPPEPPLGRGQTRLGPNRARTQRPARASPGPGTDPAGTEPGQDPATRPSLPWAGDRPGWDRTGPGPSDPPEPPLGRGQTRLGPNRARTRRPARASPGPGTDPAGAEPGQDPSDQPETPCPSKPGGQTQLGANQGRTPDTGQSLP
ncbi:uncharacterized protein LOC142820445 [Pelodiscus sinensis]|uniref:uncharacterized protein LOC142820445 n=1 Tax=Pelodiscus sinensis TaxID=13735 RepID=UPI003F6AB9A4